MKHKRKISFSLQVRQAGEKTQLGGDRPTQLVGVQKSKSIIKIKTSPDIISHRRQYQLIYE
jgi:hypothetical protein